MKNLADFRAIRERLTLEEFDRKYVDFFYHYEEEKNPTHIHSYNGLQIEEYDNGELILNLERSSYSGKLNELDYILWDWAKWEFQVPYSDIEEDIHQRARDLMSEIDKVKQRETNLSLDEYLIEFGNELTKDEVNAIEYILKEVGDIEHHRPEPNPTHRVHVEVTQNYFIDVVAEDKEQAMEIADGIDRNKFVKDNEGTWDLTYADEL